ncbi:MAG: citramalate synthase [Kiritimatiellae bacterium]|nr:citramalate synthase [Kiritimatiellia bacterium]MDD5522111.1 citramalate synthase [Kiritimatiellia bacterium]
MKNSGNKIFIYDTTLRDGAQGEGISFSSAGKMALARRLDQFGVDYIEGGYAGSNQKDMDFFRDIKKEHLSHARIVAFGATRRANTRVNDDPMVHSLIKAETTVVTVVGKAWELHVSDVLRATVKENFAMIADTIGYLKDRGREVFFDAEHFFDGYKDNPEFAMSTLEAAVHAGVDSVVLCDTNGGCLPHEIFSITSNVVQALLIPVGIHVHNDMGLAVAGSLEAVRAGAKQVQGTVNGFGERCGNANLCSIIPTLQIKMGKECVNKEALKGLKELSLFVNDLVNMRHDARAPYVGHSAFVHKAGPHVNAVQKNPRTFEHVKPESVGNKRRILVSELSGSSSVLLKAIELGVGREKSAKGAREVLSALKHLESKGYAFEAADASFRMLVQKVLKEHRSFFELEGFRVIVEKRGKNEPCLSEATIKVRVNDQVEQTAAEGDGPVNALDTALRKALVRFYPQIAKVFLTDFSVRILDPEEATAAKTRVLIESSDGEDSWGTVGVSGNIIEASWEALVDSVEYKLFREEEKKKKRRTGRTGKRRKKSKKVS